MTNGNRTGIYAYRIHQGAATKASTQAPMTAAAKCGLFDWSIVCL
jgi:hypothetical protein